MVISYDQNMHFKVQCQKIEKQNYNPWKMIENEMNIFCNVLNIWVLYDNIFNLNLYNN
jgi:hypothetical protein